VVDLSIAKLRSTDMGRLRKAAHAVAEGRPAPALDEGAQSVRSASLVLPIDGKFKDAALDAVKVCKSEYHVAV